MYKSLKSETMSGFEVKWSPKNLKEDSNKNYKNIELSDDEKQFSFLNVQFIFKKTAHPPANLLLQLQKKLKKNKD